MNLEGELEQERISKYERNILEPPLYILLKYARISNIWVDVLIDDELEIPNEIPSKTKSSGMKKEVSIKRK